MLSLQLTGEKGLQPLVFSDPAGKTQGYTLFTRSRATLNRGENATLQVKLNRAPGAGASAFLYFDWDHDGIFETSVPLTVGTSMQTTVTVPKEAALGSSRLRLRVTLNGLTDADDETAGLVFDAVVNVVAPSGVVTVSKAPPTANTFDLSGRRVETPAVTGLYIRNGVPTLLQRP